MKQNHLHGVLKVVNNCDSSSIGKVQNPELASIFDTFLTLWMEDETSWNVLLLCTLNIMPY